MLDTLRLSLNETVISNNAELIIIPGEIEYSTGLQSEYDLFVTDTGDLIRGKKAFINNELYNLTILPKFSAQNELELNQKLKYETKYNIFTQLLTDKINLDCNSKIYLQTSLPKINNILRGENNYNLNAISAVDIPKIFNFIYKDLSSRGVKTDLDGSEISRLDIFNNVETKNKYSNYSPVFNELNFSRKRQLNFGGETFLYYNKSGELCIYNKTEELKKHNINIPENTIRFEYRFLNKKSFFNRFKSSSSQYLINFQEFKKELLSLGSEIFDRDKININSFDENKIRSWLINFKARNRFWLRDFFYYEGFNSILKQIDKEQLLNILKDLLTRDKFYKIKKQIESFNFSRSIFQDQNILDLFNELKDKYFSNLYAA